MVSYFFGLSFYPNISIVTTNRINILRSHVKRLLFYDSFNQTRTVGLSTIFSKILNGKFHENPSGYSQGVPCTSHIMWKLLQSETRTVSGGLTIGSREVRGRKGP